MGDLKTRVEIAVREGRYQNALELGKQLYKQDPAPAHKELMQKIYLGRARQLRTQGRPQDAQQVLQNAVQLADGQPAVLEQIAQELAAVGEVRQALDLLAHVPASSATSRVLVQAADAALARGAAGRKLLPDAFQGQFDLILQAFSQLEAGQDEPARETLQGIGLQSPFLEWKLLLRGLMAYYQKDDARALENWQRLTSERLPARLVAPLRFRIDPAYRAALPPETQTILQRQGDRLQDSGLVQPLRVIQTTLANEEQLSQALRLAEGLLPSLRQLAPQMVQRLAACYFWTLVHSGQPEDVGRYQRVFGTPADDPHLARLRAMLFEHLGELASAHKEWQKYERGVAEHPAAWPGEQATRVRALVWCHMGHNAGLVPDPDSMPDLPPFLRDHPDRPKPLVPSAEECFRRSLELAPDQLETYEALYHYYREQEEDAQAEEVAQRLLERFPEHVPTLVDLGGQLKRRSAYAEALSLYQRALKANPLDRRLRGLVAEAHLFNARAHAEAGQFDTARSEYQTALTFDEGKNRPATLCKWAACEFKAGDPVRGEELLQQALAGADTRLAVAYSMLIETIRLKLPRALKSRFDQDFKQGLSEPPSAAAAVAIAVTTCSHRLAGVKYLGQKTHEKKVLAYVEKALRVEFTEEQLTKLGQSLLGLEAQKLLRSCATLGQRRFPHSPTFYFLEAETYIAMGPYRCPIWKVQPLLARAHDLAMKLPEDEQRKALLADIQQRQQMLGAHNLLSSPEAMGMFEDMFNQFFDFAGDDDFDEDEDDRF